MSLGIDSLNEPNNRKIRQNAENPDARANLRVVALRFEREQLPRSAELKTAQKHARSETFVVLRTAEHGVMSSSSLNWMRLASSQRPVRDS